MDGEVRLEGQVDNNAAKSFISKGFVERHRSSSTKLKGRKVPDNDKTHGSNYPHLSLDYPSMPQTPQRLTISPPSPAIRMGKKNDEQFDKMIHVEPEHKVCQNRTATLCAPNTVKPAATRS
jgi:hypothetical protein